MSLPKQKKNPDFTKVKEACKEYLNAVERGEEEIDENDIFETAMEAVFGKNVWDYINGKEL